MGIAAGTAAAFVEALLFLHEDRVFPPGGLVALERLLRERPRWSATTDQRHNSVPRAQGLSLRLWRRSSVFRIIRAISQSSSSGSTREIATEGWMQRKLMH
jgi:hypothetical protein